MEVKKHHLSAQDAWVNTMIAIHSNGDVVSPRGIGTREILGNSFSFDMNYPVCYHQDRRLSYNFMAREAWTIACGTNAVSDINRYNSNIAKFSDNGVSFAGAYGPMFIYQRDYIIDTLVKDRHSRQAVFTIWKPNPGSSADYPCTLVFNFQIRNGKMHTFVNMRSSDAWLGLPYDMFNFTIMTLNVLAAYNLKSYSLVELGHMHMMLNSSHLYDTNYDESRNVILNAPDKMPELVHYRTFGDWDFVLRSLEACYDQHDHSVFESTEGDALWKIRP